MWVRVKSLQSCWTLCDPVDRSLPGSSVHGILQARILKWVAIYFSRGSSWLRDQTLCILHLLHWQVGSLPLAPLGKPPLKLIHLGSASFYSLTASSPFPHPLVPGNHHSISVLISAMFWIPHISEIKLYLSFSDLFHLAWCPKFHHSVENGRISFFMANSPLCVGAIFLEPLSNISWHICMGLFLGSQFCSTGLCGLFLCQYHTALISITL